MQECEQGRSLQASISYWTMLSMDPTYGTLDDFIPGFSEYELKAARQGWDPDSPSFNDGIAGPHAEEFEKAMIREIAELEK